MCGRATLVTGADEIAAMFGTEPLDLGAPRYNVAPTQPMLTVRATSAATRELALARWGLIPWWAKPDEAKRIASRCIQARAETARRTAAFRDAFRRHRCLVVVDGFFEWKTLGDGRRIPHLARKSPREPFAIAGLWDEWRGAPDQAPAGELIQSCAVLTIPAGGRIREIHDRMPLVLSVDEWNAWLSGTPDDAAALLATAQDTRALDRRAEGLGTIPVSTWVNDVRHDDPRCIEPDAGSPVPAASAGFTQVGFAFAATPARRSRKAR